MIQLIDAAHLHPADATQTAYASMLTPGGLSTITTYASAISVCKRLIIPVNEDGLAPPTLLIPDAHAAGLSVHAWTFRDEPQFLAADYHDDPRREYRQFLSLGLDGLITDFPATASSLASAMDKSAARGYRDEEIDPQSAKRRGDGPPEFP